MTAVAGLVLAAGEGRRFGMPKALAEFDGETFVARAVGLLSDGGCDPVVVVVGAAAAEVTAAATAVRAQAVPNPDWPSGMASSLRAGLDALALLGAEAAVIALVDQPRLGPDAVGRLIAAWRRGAAAAVATYRGEARNPVLLDRRVWAEVTAAVTGDEGARSWLRANPERVTPVPCDGTGDPADIDTPADLPHTAV